MKKSSYIFVIMAIVYFLISIGYFCGLITIHNNIVFGLSITALLISISDFFSKVVVNRVVENEYQKMIDYTLVFLDEKIKQKQIDNPIINIRNLRGNIEVRKKKKYTSVHPLEYANNRLNKVLNTISIVLFIIGISAFIITPFIAEHDYMATITPPITALAFAAMCVGIFLDDLIQRKQEEQNSLVSDKHTIVQAAFPDFLSYYNMQMYYHNDIKAVQQEWESKAEKESKGKTKE